MNVIESVMYVHDKMSVLLVEFVDLSWLVMNAVAFSTFIFSLYCLLSVKLKSKKPSTNITIGKKIHPL